MTDGDAGRAVAVRICYNGQYQSRAVVDTDGSAYISVSMLLAALLKVWGGAAELPVIGLLHQMTRWEDGVIIVATLLLFPTALTFWGGTELFLMARERVKQRYEARGVTKGIVIGVEQGREEGRREERERIDKILKEKGIDVSLE